MSKVLFEQRIKLMNEMYKLPVSDTPSVDQLKESPFRRLEKFKSTILKEVMEINEILEMTNPANINQAPKIDVLVALADLLADITVYCRSEALKFGLPLEEVLEIIMDSNESKLDANGNPIYDEDGAFRKGPNYWKPEPKIKELLLSRLI